MAIDNPKDIEKFLNNVDQITDIIQSLNSTDDSDREKAMVEADKLISRGVKQVPSPIDNTGVNRTVINKSTGDSHPQSGYDTSSLNDQDSFMKAIEKDAEERSERKNAARVEASKFKERGNVAFKEGDYNKAIELYTQGLDRLKDYRELWSNRAQAHLRLGEFKEALTDADWAQRCDESFVKAYVLKAKAHLGLKQYSEAIEEYRKATKADRSKQTLMEEYIREAELSRDSANQERDVRKMFEGGARHAGTLVDVMMKVRTEGELPMYYDGGVRVLSDLLIDNKCKTLFRTEGGLELYFKHPFFYRTMMTESPNSLSAEELDACGSMMSLLQRAVSDNDESQRSLIGQPSFAEVVMRFLDPQVLKKKRPFKEACLDLLFCLTVSEIGRKCIATQFDLTQLLKVLFELVRMGDNIAVKCFNIVKNMALDARFKRSLYTCLDTVLPAFEQLLTSDDHTEIIPSCICIMTNLCTDDRIRNAMSSHATMIDACISYIDKFPASFLEQHRAYHRAVHTALGLLMNLTLDKTDSVKLSALAVTKCVLAFLEKEEEVEERVVGTLSHILPLSTKAVDYFISKTSGLKVLLNLLSLKKYPKYVVKVVTACTQNSQSTCQLLANHSHALQSLKHLLLNDSSEVLLGNVCLCLSHCIQQPPVNQCLDKDCIKKLLVLVREANNSAVKQNCAILLGKLVKTNARHLESLRELDGIGILHNSTRHYKL